MSERDGRREPNETSLLEFSRTTSGVLGKEMNPLVFLALFHDCEQTGSQLLFENRLLSPWSIDKSALQ